jgi:hypothetical protein
VTQEMPTPEIDASVPVPAKVGASAENRKPLVALAELADPDSLEAKVAESAESLPKWRLEQEQARSKREQELTEKISSAQSNGDVLQVFEAEMAKPQNNDRAFNERARGVADESEELLSMEALAAPTAQAAPIPKAAPAPAPQAPAPVAKATPAPAPQAAVPVAKATPAPQAASVADAAPTPALELAPEPQAAQAAQPAPAPVAAPEPASVTQPLAALALLETPAEQPQQLGLLADDAPTTPAPEVSPQLELLADDRKQALA